MFDSFSWDDFLLLAILALTGYYVIAVVFFYRREVSMSAKSFKNPSPLIERPDLNETNIGGGFLGKARPDIPPPSEHVTTTPSDLLQFAEQKGSNGDEPHKGQQDALLIGAVADLLEETKTLVQVIADCEGDKGESIPMFQALLAKYPHIADTKFRAPINMYLLEECKQQCDFEMAIGEIDSWWPKF